MHLDGDAMTHLNSGNKQRALAIRAEVRERKQAARFERHIRKAIMILEKAADGIRAEDLSGLSAQHLAEALPILKNAAYSLERLKGGA